MFFVFSVLFVLSVRVLVTGGAGFIGSHIVEAYIHAGHEVAVVDKKARGVLQYARTKIRYFQHDITQPGLETIFATFKPEVINHHAALIHVAESMTVPVTYADGNVVATIRLLQLSKVYGVKQFLFASSVAVYGETERYPIQETDPCKPISFYGLDKWIAEQYIRLLGKEMVTTIFRYANVYGPRQNSSAEGGVVAIFAKALGRRGTVSAPSGTVTIYGDGTQTRDFIYVKDVAQANRVATEKRIAGLFQVSTNTETSIQDLFNLIKKKNDREMTPDYGPRREGDIARSVLSNEKIKTVIGWQPEHSLEEGLRETVEYFKMSNSE